MNCWCIIIVKGSRRSHSLLKRINSALLSLITTPSCDRYYVPANHIYNDIIVWGSASTWLRISVFLLKRYDNRIIAGVGPREHCKPLFVKFRILTVYSMYILSCLLYVRRNINSFTTFAQVHNYNTRNNSNLYPEKVKFSLTQNNFVYNSVKIFNNLPLDLRNIPLLAFSRRIRTKLLGNPLYSLSEFADISW